nr:GNAT family N-acetyltransferase [Falsiroseomonas tokyonensis]
MEAAFAGGGLQVIEHEGHPIGCIGLEPRAEAVELHSLYLEPDLQGRGLGATIVAQALALYPGRRFDIEVLKDSPARRFWERQGFGLVGEQPFDWIMARPPSD